MASTLWRYRWLVGVVLFAVYGLSRAGEADELGQGREIYRDACASCHGNEMMNPGLAFDLRKFPKGDPERFRNSVLNGKGQGMPALKGQLSAEDIEALWAYVKSGG